MPISLGIGTAVTRGGGLSWSPLSIPGLQFWVDAADSATLFTDFALTTLAVADGDDVGGWKDKSGNSRNALQNDGAKKPMLKIAIQNGRNVVRWDNTNDILETPATISIGLMTCFSVFRAFANTSSRVIVYNGNAAALLYNFVLENTVAAAAIYDGNSSGNYLVASAAAAASTSWEQRTCVRSSLSISGRWSMRQNGAASALTVSSTGVATPFVPSSQTISLGNYSTTINYPIHGDISEVLIYDSALSGSDILLVEAYLKAKWGTP